jgi:hypothetical protein
LEGRGELNMDRYAEAHRFLSALFADKPDDSLILTWVSHGKRSTFHKNVEDAAKAAAEAKGDIYFGCCGCPPGLSENQRASIDQVNCIFGVWADIDVRDNVHKKKNLPPDEKSAMKIIEEMPFKPSAIIFTGHGFHVWWFLAEPMEINTAEERQRATRLVQGWGELLKQKAKGHNWIVDPVFDLARILRPPGSFNHKRNQKVSTAIRMLNGSRYLADDLEDYIPENIKEDISDAAQVKLQEGDYRLDAMADPPADKLALLIANDSTFYDTYTKNRAFPSGDNSQSEYDLSLATQVLTANWTEQEAVDLIIHHRRIHGAKPKLRQDYFKKFTIFNAKTTSNKIIAKIEKQERKEESARSIGEGIDIEEEDVNEEPQEELQKEEPQEELQKEETQEKTKKEKKQPKKQKTKKKQKKKESFGEIPTSMIKARKKLEKWTGCKILKIYRTISDKTEYIMIIEKNSEKIRIEFGGKNEVTDKTKFINSFWNMTGDEPYIPPKDPEWWSEFKKCFWVACEPLNVGTDATMEGQATEWIREYVDSNGIVGIEDLHLLISKAIQRGNDLMIRAPSFKDFVKLNYGIRLKKDEDKRIFKAIEGKESKLTTTEKKRVMVWVFQNWFQAKK